MIWFSFFSLLFKITLASVRGKGWKGQEKKQKILKVWLTFTKDDVVKWTKFIGMEIVVQKVVQPGS